MTDARHQARLGGRRALVLASVAFVLCLGGAADLARAALVGATGEVFRLEGRLELHPRRWAGMLVVTRDVGPDAHFRVSYSRAIEKHPNRGSVTVALEIRRDTDGDGSTDAVERLTVAGKVEDLGFEAVAGPLAPLRAGDLVLAHARLERIPRTATYQRADLEVALLDSASSCPDLGPIPGGVEPPRKILFPSPRYTEAARRARIQGTVLLHAIIDCDGRVRRIRVLEELPLGLTGASVEALAQWRFEPARAEGVPVRVLLQLTVNFRLQGGRAPSGDALGPSVTVGELLVRPAE